VQSRFSLFLHLFYTELTVFRLIDAIWVGRITNRALKRVCLIYQAAMALFASHEWNMDIGEDKWTVTMTPQRLQQHRNKQKRPIGEDCNFTWALEGPGLSLVFGDTQHLPSAGKDSRHDMQKSRHDMQKRILHDLFSTWDTTQDGRRIRMETEDHTSVVAAEMPRAIWHLLTGKMRRIEVVLHNLRSLAK
jgi:hypothetical protein